MDLLFQILIASAAVTLMLLIWYAVHTLAARQSGTEGCDMLTSGSSHCMNCSCSAKSVEGVLNETE